MTAHGRSNCLLWAVLLYLRRRAKGKPGYLMIRRSRWGAFPHILYAEARPHGLRVVSYVPRDPRVKACPPKASDIAKRITAGTPTPRLR